MTGQNRQNLPGVVAQARDTAILVIARLWPGEDFASIEDRLNRQSIRVQAEVTLSVLGYLFALALFAGQFGPLGLMLYVGAVLFAMR